MSLLYKYKYASFKLITRRKFLKISLGISGLAIFSLSPCYAEKFIDTYQINLPTKEEPINVPEADFDVLQGHQ
jgi:hypothetical protein